MTFILIFQLLVLLFSVILHEISHGYIAYYLGDDTAKQAGRLTFNPIAHLDLWGSFLFPLFLYFLSGGAFVFGWAKPVPFNPLKLKNPKKSIGLVGLSGPLTNFLIALVFAIIFRLIHFFNIASLQPLTDFLGIIIYINILLAVFNLVPIPPLDGSRVLYSFLPVKYEHFYWNLERYGLMLVMLLVFFGFRFITPLIDIIFKILIG
ncbi:MAG: site-2 protease family protein [Patescibacteria group bacterium]|jgi:Zn-dependent protease|nr:site-2 protease family protein [Patescibacteria group bacterium]